MHGLSLDTRRASLSRLSRPSGAFAMLALDQRESLRTMFAQHSHDPVADDTLVHFKVTAAKTLSPHASALLIDRQFGLDAVMRTGALDKRCALIVAADRLTQEPGGPVTDTDVDTGVDAHEVADLGAVALKLLLIWYPDDPAERRADLVRRFLAKCHDGGLLGIVEVIVRPPRHGSPDEWDREAAVIEAARESGALHPDVYKAEVPYHGRADRQTIERRCREISAVLPCPWVVLSQGVDADDFPGAVEAACAGGASGFLAGRAVWADTIGTSDYRAAMETRSVARLETLGAIVDRAARPWWSAVETEEGGNA